MIIVKPSESSSVRCHCCGRACENNYPQKRDYYHPTNDPYKHIWAQVEYPTCAHCHNKYYNKTPLRLFLVGMISIIVLISTVYIYFHSSDNNAWVLATVLGLLFSFITYVWVYERMKTKKDCVPKTDLHVALISTPNRWCIHEIQEGIVVNDYSEDTVRDDLEQIATSYDLTILYPYHAFRKYQNVGLFSDIELRT